MSGTKRAKALSRYRDAISSAAAAVVPSPTRSPRLDIEVWFRATGVSRADVDNVLKPILDALKGVVYVDDSQVRSVRVVALPTNDAYQLNGTITPEMVSRLLHGNAREFLVDVYEGLSLPGPGV